MKFGLPEEIPSDNGSEYIDTELTHLCNYFEIQFKLSTTYAPWTKGLVEGTNRIIGQFIRTLLNEKKTIGQEAQNSFLMHIIRNTKHNYVCQHTKLSLTTNHKNQQRKNSEQL